MKYIFHEKGPSSNFSCLSTFPPKVFLPLLWQTENPQPVVHNFQMLVWRLAQPWGCRTVVQFPALQRISAVIIE